VLAGFLSGASQIADNSNEKDIRLSNYDAYWHGIREEVAATDKDWDRQPRADHVEAHGVRWRCEWIRFSSVGDQLIWGWYCTPEDHPSSRTGVLWLPGYSYGTSPPDHNSLIPGAVVMGINVHGNSPDAPYINPTGVNDYATDGIDDPMRYIYRRIVAHCLRALVVLATQPEVDGNRLVTSGMSQGATLALIVAAQEPDVRICFADMPFLSDIYNTLQSRSGGAYRALSEYVARNPDSDALETLELFDPNITAPVWLSAGGRDPSVKPAAVERVYARLASPYKEFQVFQGAGHEFVPEMNAARFRWLQNWGQLIRPF